MKRFITILMLFSLIVVSAIAESEPFSLEGEWFVGSVEEWQCYAFHPNEKGYTMEDTQIEYAINHDENTITIRIVAKIKFSDDNFTEEVIEATADFFKVTNGIYLVAYTDDEGMLDVYFLKEMKTDDSAQPDLYCYRFTMDHSCLFFDDVIVTDKNKQYRYLYNNGMLYIVNDDGYTRGEAYNYGSDVFIYSTDNKLLTLFIRTVYMK